MQVAVGADPYLSLHTNHYPLNKKYPPNLGEYFFIVLVCLRFGYVNFEHRRDNLRLRRDVSAACQIISFFSQPDSAEMVKNAAKNNAMIFILSFLPIVSPLPIGTAFEPEPRYICGFDFRRLRKFNLPNKIGLPIGKFAYR